MVLSAIIGSLVLALSGCSDQSGQTEKTLRVGVITYSQDDPFINALTDELKVHLKTMESEERRIIVSIKSGNDDQQEQNEKVEEMIDAGCDVLCVNLVDRTAPYRIIRMARNENIPVIFFNREPVKEDLMQWDKLYYVGCDAEQSGIMQGEIAAEYINSHPEVDKNEDGKIQYVLLEGESGCHQQNRVFGKNTDEEQCFTGKIKLSVCGLEPRAGGESYEPSDQPIWNRDRTGPIQ